MHCSSSNLRVRRDINRVRCIQPDGAYNLDRAGRCLDQMVTIQQIPLEKIRGKRILVLIDPNIEKAARTLGSLIGTSAKLIVATHVGGPGGQSPTKLKLDFPKGTLPHSRTACEEAP